MAQLDNAMSDFNPFLNSVSKHGVYKLTCDVSDDERCIEDLFHCKHPECVNDKRIYCGKECAEFWHKKKKKGHQFVIGQDRKLRDEDENEERHQTIKTNVEYINNQQSMPVIASTINPINSQYTSFSNVSSQVMSTYFCYTF